MMTKDSLDQRVMQSGQKVRLRQHYARALMSGSMRRSYLKPANF
jgi:hypothetical protein